jgi:hypothetical protein
MNKLGVCCILIAFTLLLSVGSAQATPDWDGGLLVWPFWQMEVSGAVPKVTWAKDAYAGISGKTIAANGCAITSLAMLLNYHGEVAPVVRTGWRRK